MLQKIIFKKYYETQLAPQRVNSRPTVYGQKYSYHDIRQGRGSNRYEHQRLREQNGGSFWKQKHLLESPTRYSGTRVFHI